ncbi:MULTISPECIES: hypothetical protein [unclassified Helicobacter]|uniref:hypothetical protein n=1 Tax=unclassified Helicobacter TaxID=2593540 RepID=UPI000CF0F204|nr:MULTISPECIES: hypothetical protein [unclassified Helicobacter]
MRVEVSKELSDCLILNGRIKDYDEFLEFKADLKDLLERYNKEEPICFFLNQAYPLEFCAIGYFLKLKEFDSWDISIHTNDIRIFKFFEKLGLSEKFKVMVRELR